MRIGIITILKVNNYGAELQAYATQAILNKLGYTAEIIDYLFYKNPNHQREKKSEPSFKLSLKTKMKEWLFPIIQKVKSLFNDNNRKLLREQRFSDFHRDNTALSKTYRNYSELLSEKLNYDVYISGSDQIWNPNVFTSLDPYVLSFAPDSCRKIAYASSFGVSSIPQHAQSFYRTRLNRYDAIGVREGNAVELVWKVANKKATLVLDPTLLLTHQDWMKVANPHPNFNLQNFILIYELTPCEDVKQLAETIGAYRHIPIVRICKDSSIVESDGRIINITDAGPAEFLWLFDRASFIVTNSFHGTAFAINFNKEFYTITPARKQNNSRQQSLLNLLGLSNRLVPEGYPVDIDQKIDYENVNQILDIERRRSIEFLTNAIDGE